LYEHDVDPMIYSRKVKMRSKEHHVLWNDKITNNINLLSPKGNTNQKMGVHGPLNILVSEMVSGAMEE
jgi:hypothetical protein